MTAEARAREDIGDVGSREMWMDSAELGLKIDDLVLKAYREGQSNPNAAAVARVLGEAAQVALNHMNDKGNTAGHRAGALTIAAEIEAMIPEPEPKEAGECGAYSEYDPPRGCILSKGHAGNHEGVTQ